MATFHDLTTAQLRQAVQLKEQIESLQEKLASLLGGTATASATPKKGKRKMSAAARAAIGAAQKARWAKTKGTPAKTVAKKSAPTKAAPKKKGAITPEGRAALSTAMKARWAARKQGEPALNAPAK